MGHLQDMSLKVAGMFHLLLNAWNKDLVAGAGAAKLDKGANVGMDGAHCCEWPGSLTP